jgi:hypothetical protein
MNDGNIWSPLYTQSNVNLVHEQCHELLVNTQR